MRLFSLFVILALCATFGSSFAVGYDEDGLVGGESFVLAELVDQLEQVPTKPVVTTAPTTETTMTLKLTAAILNQATGCGLDTAAIWVDPINAVTGPAQINTIARLAAFIAQTAHESGRYKTLHENLNYRADGLLKHFKKHFSSSAEAAAFAHQPEKIANRVYAGRMGNGPESSGDGWNFSGKGLIQLTGRKMYELASKALNLDLVNHPELVLTPTVACQTSAWFWTARKLNSYADRQDFVTMTKRINGGKNGLADREQLLSKATQALLDADLHKLLVHVTAVMNQHLANPNGPPAAPVPPAPTPLPPSPDLPDPIPPTPIKGAVASSTCPGGVAGTCQLSSVHCASGVWKHGICPGASVCCTAAPVKAVVNPTVVPATAPAKTATSTCPGGVAGTCQLMTVHCASGVWKHGICPGANACCTAAHSLVEIGEGPVAPAAPAPTPASGGAPAPQPWYAKFDPKNRSPAPTAPVKAPATATAPTKAPWWAKYDPKNRSGGAGAPAKAAPAAPVKPAVKPTVVPATAPTTKVPAKAPVAPAKPASTTVPSKVCLVHPAQPSSVPIKKAPAPAAHPATAVATAPAKAPASTFHSSVVDALNLAPNAKAAALTLLQKVPSVIFTSGRRDLGEQANAMASNVIYNRQWIGNTYATNEASTACQNWVDKHPEAKSQLAIAKGLYDTLHALPDSARAHISRHLSGQAFDVQPVDGAIGRQIVAEIQKLPNLEQFLTSEGGLTRWHAAFYN